MRQPHAPREPKRCLWPGCPNPPEARERLCIACQLAGRIVVRQRELVAVETEEMPR